MFNQWRKPLSLLLAFTLTLVPLMAQGEPDHILSTSALHQSLRAAKQGRQNDIARIGRFLEMEPAQRVLRTAQLSSAEVVQRLSTLSDEELSSLAARTGKIERDVVAGDRGMSILKFVIVGAAAATIIALVVTHKAT